MFPGIKLFFSCNSMLFLSLQRIIKTEIEIRTSVKIQVILLNIAISTSLFKIENNKEIANVKNIAFDG
jgi:hypothetical protein